MATASKKQPIIKPEELVKVTVPQAPPEGKSSKVLVVSKFDRFVDLVNNVEITQTPTAVEMHPWLQNNVDAGLVILC